MNKNSFAIVLMVMCFHLLGQTPGDNDSTFNANDLGYFNGEGVNGGSVYASLIQPDGKIIIAGLFSSYNTSGKLSIARILPNGLLDNTFISSGVFYNPIYALALQPDGKILIGGSFTSYNGTSIKSLARLNSDGTIDLSFNPGAGPNYTISTIALEPDGKIVIGGKFNTYNNISTNYLARVNYNGSLDTSFHVGVGPNLPINTAAIQSDGKILIGGSFTSYNGVSSKGLARLNINGSIDTAFHVGTGTNGVVNAITIKNDGKILIGGDFLAYNNIASSQLTRINSDGTKDNSFNSYLWINAIVDAIAIDTNDRILVGGINLITGGNHNVIRVNSNGSLDSLYSQANSINGRARTLSLQQDEKLFIGGDIISINSDYVRRIARINTNGTIDLGFNYRTAANSSITTCVVQPDQKILIGGNFTAYNNKDINRISRLNGDGSIDTTFLTSGTYGGANGVVNTIALQSDNKIIVGGNFTTFHSGNCQRLIRLLPSGLVDSTFNLAYSDDIIYATAIQPDGKIIVAGKFITINSAVANRIVRLNTDGSTDFTFNPPSGANNIVYSVALQPDGKILIGGFFTMVNGISRNRIARLNINGTLDLTFNSGTGTNNTVNAIAVQTDGKIVIGGDFTTYNGVSKGRLARLSASGALETSYNAGLGFNASIQSISFQADGKTVISGGFDLINGNTAYVLSRFNINGTVDSTFFVKNYSGYIINSTAIQNDGKIIAGGSFPVYNAVGRNNIARVLVDCGPPAVLNSTSYQELNICNGNSTLLTASATGTITWYSSVTSTIVIATGNTYTTPVLSVGSYTYYAEAFSCMQGVIRTPFIVQVNPTPTITVSSGTICSGQSFAISPSGASFYTYSGGSAIVSPTTTTTYTVIGSSGGCTDTKTLSVNVNALPTFTLPILSGTATCANYAVGLAVNTNTLYNVLWSGPGAINPAPTVYNPTVTTSGIYTVTVTDGNSCTNTGTVSVTSDTTSPVFTLTSSMLPVCAGSSVSISANPTGTNSVSYLWDNAATTQSIVVTPAITTVSSATVTDNNNGCYSSQTITVNVNPLPTLTITGTNTVCLGTSTTLSVTNGGIVYFSWSNGSFAPLINVIPSLTTIYTLTVTDINGCTNTETVSVTVDNTCADVWPGDANSDGVADNLDVLELGLHYTQTGAPRVATSNTWQSYFANNWIGTITNGSNLNHSDCNGDGTINDDDTLAIYNNYGLTHAFKPAQTNTVNPQLSIVPDQAMVTKGNWGTASIYLGDATTTINNINGIAFTVDFDNTLIEPNSIYLEYQNSFIDAAQNLYFRKLDFANGTIFTASTHTVSNNASGFGKIATLHYQILSSLATDQVLNIGLSQANQSNASGLITPLTSGTGTLMAIGASVGVKESVLIGGLMISPNPTNGFVNIVSANDLQSVEVTTIAGQVLLKQTCADKSQVLQLQNLADGVYFVKVIFANGSVVVRKIVKQ